VASADLDGDRGWPLGAALVLGRNPLTTAFPVAYTFHEFKVHVTTHKIKEGR